MKVFSSDVTVEILYRVYGLLHGPALHVPSFSIGLIKTEFELLDQLKLTHEDECWW